MRKLNGVDCSTTLTHSLVAGLKANGIHYVARYLGNCWKSMNKVEADTILEAGLRIVSIWETNPTKAAYFTKEQGIIDAKEANAYAKAILQTEGSAIYFAVDYDAQPADMKAILTYFSGVRNGIDKSYKIGVYGSYSVLKTLYNQKTVDFYWQTTSWSRGHVADFIDILQYKHNTPLAGIQVDYNQFTNRAGSWSRGTNEDTLHHVATQYTVQPGDTLSVIAIRFGTTVKELVKFNKIENPNMIFIGQILQLPNINSTEPFFYIIKSGDTLDKIAINYGTTVAQLQAWNGITNPNLIMAGKRIRVK